uniref:Protein kinase domain-containing protein n=1 Tax=Parascaris univalens TaxID=6257 RepID=A0A914ZV24_PARUN
MQPAANVPTVNASTIPAAANTSAQGTAAARARADNDNDKDSESEGDGAEEILEESPCKRWSKRREQVKQRDVPGIDFAYLAMDNETGNEVVWNEVLFSERKNFRAQEEKINAVFDNLTHLVHTNLVKFHKYWTDAKSEKPRIIFITEYMSSGSLARFLQRTRKSGSSLSLKAWKKWTTQILSALNYLHSCNPPIVHANLTCNTMFIQHNGLIKIGCVAPNAIHHHVKTFRENIKNMHYIAPEYEHCTAVAPPADIYSFGICALEMALPVGLGGCSGNGSCESTVVTQEMIRKALDSIEDPMQKNFIASCLNLDPSKRPTARELLFHTILFEVHSLKLLAAHQIVASKLNDSLNEDDLRVDDPERVAAVSKFREMAYCQVPAFQVDLDKFLEDVSNGIYPLTAFAPLAHQPRMTASTSSSALTTDNLIDFEHGSDSGDRPEPTPSPPGESPTVNTESRAIVKLNVSINGSLLTIMLQLDDMMNRQLTTELHDSDTASALVAELIQHGLVSEADEEKLVNALSEALEKDKMSRNELTGDTTASSAPRS